MFECVIAVTIMVYDLAATETAYRDHLGYQVQERGEVSEALASQWGAPAMAGKSYISMQPESGADFRVRFIETTPVDGYAALTTQGWNAMELLVRDPDEMAERLKDSPFTIIGMPRDLSSDGNVRAMQVTGPSGEVVYLTRIKGERTRLYGSAQSRVDRAFILVVGARNFESLVEFYGKRFDHAVQTFGKAPISVLSNALGLPPADTFYDMKLARLGQQFSIELDGYPDVVVDRPRRDGELPPGMAMVSFGVGSLAALVLNWHTVPASLDESFYRGGKVAVTTGVAGEWLEFVESQVHCKGD